MRWKARPARRLPERGEQRRVFAFLILPRRFGDEWRWLEYTGAIQRYEDFMTGGGGWQDVSWID